MAAPTGNLLSLGHFNGTQQNAFIKQKAHCEKKSINKPTMFQDRFSAMRQGHRGEIHLQQQWQELQERERIAQQHNRQLLQQFEEAQDTLKEMLARNAAMKTIRVEYERYLEENFPRWQQQLQEKTQAAEKKKMEDYLRSYLKKTEQEQMSKSTQNWPSLSQGPSIRPQKNIPHAHSTQEYCDYNQDRSQHPYLQSSWLTHTQSQTGRFPVRVPAQTHSPSILPQPNFPHPHAFIHHIASTGGPHHPQSRQDAAFWGPSEHNCPRPWAAGIPPGSWGQLLTEEPPFEPRVWQTGKQEDEISRAPSSKRERGGGSGSSRLSPELDIKPVRLPSAHAESSESGRESSMTSSQEKRKKREKKGRTQHSSSDSERCGSRGSSRTSSEIVIAPVAVPQISVTETSTEEESTRSTRRSKRSGGLTAASPRSEKAVEEQKRNHYEESQSAGEESGGSSKDSMKEEAGNQSHDENTESCREEQESGSDGVKNENRFKDDTEKQENSSSENRSSEQSSAEENEEEMKHLGAGDEENDKKEDSEKNESDEEENDENEVSAKTNTTGEEVETAGEDEDDQEDHEEPNKLENKDVESKKQGSASSQDEDDQEDDEEPNKLENKDVESRKRGSASSQDEDEDGSEGNESTTNDEEGSNEEEDGESEEEEEHRSEKAEEENRDSEDSIISPQEKRSKQMHIIPEDPAEDEDEDDDSKDGSSTNDSNEVSDEDNVENLLAPQDQSKTEVKDGKADGKPKVICHVDIFQVTDVGPKTDYHSDSDEFDHFYD